ncbi:two component, sigma54 specific, transcriptional regulator, Fis family protein [Minicystis rosea]|nr:two component, sigma54 specific, transcriptional regulator, Fis family protein [Minicystis rosea]
MLVVDDEPAVRFTLKEVLADRGHDVTTAASGAEALTRLDGVEAVVTDLAMPSMDGLELLRMLRERDASLPVTLLTAHGSEKVAVAAMKAGAYDYATKPFDIDEIVLVVERALEARMLRDRARRLAAEHAIGRRIIGESAPMRRLLDAVARVADKDVTVLVRGETGTGKELVGSLLHAESHRADRPLVRFNCAAIPGELAEAELFGHHKGAFTGAHATRRGFFAEADGSTLVLDEVGELPLGVQAKLLRAIQEGEIQPVGSGRVERVDVRVVACTNRDLLAEARAGRFREDLYYRLAVIELVVPTLGERAEDIPALAEELARRYGDKFGLPGVRLAPALLDRLKAASWPGNVRQLENTIARLVALASGPVIEASAFTPMDGPTDPPRPLEAAPEESNAEGPSLREQVEAFERSLIAKALAAAHGNQSEAARRLGTSRATLIDKIKKHRLGSD